MNASILIVSLLVLCAGYGWSGESQDHNAVAGSPIARIGIPPDSLTLAQALDSMKRFHVRDSVLDERRMDSIELHAKKIMGYRFRIKGKFGGSSHFVSLTEHYVSTRDHQETNKYYEGLEGDLDAYGLLVTLTERKMPLCYLESTDSVLPRFELPSSNTGQLLGLSLLRNEGDLDGDGSDEISFVMNWADWSSVNSCYIASFINGSWHIVYSFDIRDWQLPGLPDVQEEFGMFGVSGIVQAPSSEASSEALKELRAFPGFIQKVGKGKIKVHTFNDEVEEISKVVDLKKITDKIRSKSGSEN
ncbi:MAG: hypothetical protein Q8916_09195 [Bacteroidota bacterium]|nr:hypothetical protein [Bacteroidota bacterium]MDP4230562.1 hypothetical protein [Bacteroidota bacterium]MDP4236681.1 hypothetical protein [Bacteroidota bacterium]